MTLTLPRWEQEISTLENVRIIWDDQLFVENGNVNLGLFQGNYTRGETSRITIIDPGAIGDHIQQLIKFGKTHFSELKSQQGNKEFCEQFISFQRKIKQLSDRTGQVQFALRTLNPEYAERYSQLHKQIHTLKERIKIYKKNPLIRPLLSAPPIRHIEYNARTELRSIKCFYPKNVPLADTVVAAQQALALSRVRPPQSLLNKIISVISFALKGIPYAGAAFLTVIKIIVLNPIEWLVRGEVRTMSPLRWLAEDLKPRNTHTRAYQLYCEQILRQPRLTEDVVNAFNELSGDAKYLYLKEFQVTAAHDVRELAPFIEEKTLPLNAFLERLQSVATAQGQDIQLLAFDDIATRYDMLNGLFEGRYPPENRNQSVEPFLNSIDLTNVRFLSPGKGEPFITRAGLEALLNSAFASPTCRKIILPRALLQTSYVKDLLRQHSYRFMAGDRYDVTYRRYNFI